ncbi:MAG: hypothetical protein HY582_03985 [Candidatus Omnitrophica bacterium]|nr:hypothetical protein [Candidatus Omnitrophota bacterium]
MNSRNIHRNRNSFFWWYVSIYVMCVNLYCSGTGLAGLFDRDPIAETQTKVVPATEETIKNSGKGAPAPTFKIVEDTGKFFIEKPYYEELEQKKKSERSWWWEEEKSQPKEDKEDTDSSSKEQMSQEFF